MKLINVSLLVLLPLACLQACNSRPQGYHISISLKGYDGTDSLFLSKRENGKPLIVQKSAVRSQKTELTGNRPLQPGMYTAGIAGKGSFDFFLSDTLNQNLDISVDLKNILSTLVFENSAENSGFAALNRSLYTFAGQQKSMQLRMRRNSSSPDSMYRINEAYMRLKEELDRQSEALKKEFPGSMLALYIGLITEPVVPEPVIPATVTNPQQVMQEYYFNYLTAHFFDHFDFSDPRIITIPLFEEKTGFYFRQMIPPLPDSILARAEALVQKSSLNDSVYNHTVRYLYRLFRESPVPELMEISDRIGDIFILPDPGRWKDEPFVSKVRERVTRTKLNPVGAVATDLKLKKISGETVRLSEIKAPLIILYFFNPECDACGPITDQLIPITNRFKNQGVEVFAVYLDRKMEVWKPYLAEKKADWINVYDPDGSEQVEARYDIYALPMIYLLDREKKTIARDVPVNTLGELILQNLK